MPYRHLDQIMPTLLAAVLATSSATASDAEIVIDDGSSVQDTEIMIDGGDETPLDGDILIDGGGTASESRVMSEGEPDNTGGTFSIGLDEARFEYGHFTDSDSATENALYGHLAASMNWQPNPAWEIQLAGRVDGYDEDHTDSFTTVRGDYGDSFIRYRGDNVKLTIGTQTVVWGRLDELPLSDRVSTVDLTRLILDDLADRRRSNPMLRAETFFGVGKFDLVWLFDFRPAELPDQESIWHPVDRRRGRLLGIDPADIPAAAIQSSMMLDDEPGGDGGFGARYAQTLSFGDIGFTVARTRQSMPYYRIAGIGVLQAEYPRSWALGTDAAINAMGATWRLEMLYSSDNPVTRTDLSYTTTQAMQWGAGVEIHPGDGDTRLNLQIIGMNLIGAPAILDRTEIYGVNGEIEMPFDRERWRAKADFNIGLDSKDIYINPEIAFVGWEPHEFYLAGHYFDGDAKTLGGFYSDQSTIIVGWRARF